MSMEPIVGQMVMPSSKHKRTGQSTVHIYRHCGVLVRWKISDICHSVNEAFRHHASEKYVLYMRYMQTYRTPPQIRGIWSSPIREDEAGET